MKAAEMIAAWCFLLAGILIGCVLFTPKPLFRIVGIIVVGLLVLAGIHFMSLLRIP
jgi:hypothetical protein